MPTMDDPCPCGLPADYAACCGRFHTGASAPTAEALMRSRYAAFVKRDAAYLLRTEHPFLRAKHDARGMRQSFSLAWRRLEILDHGGDDREAMVHFRAVYLKDGREQAHEERSRFVRDADGAWVYRDGR
jgi:SEC-C motif-containing protein